ncbi:MAG: Peptidyl-prolyl cis-trans isomerase [uncultured bacterium]|nr:MAG: Peptidyl-prolyl cis-trans isomerase [uncultured bacterium]
MNNKILITLCVVAAVVAGYVLLGGKPASAPETKKAETKEVATKKESVNSNNEKKPMELEIKTTQEGTGDRVIKSGDTIAVHYTGKLTDGTKFDSSVDRGTPFEFKIGQGMVIAGWEQGFIGAKVGEKRTLTIPSELGYGSRGAGASIPPNATLIFDVEVISIK